MNFILKKAATWATSIPISPEKIPRHTSTSTSRNVEHHPSTSPWTVNSSSNLLPSFWGTTTFAWNWKPDLMPAYLQSSEGHQVGGCLLTAGRWLRAEQCGHSEQSTITATLPTERQLKRALISKSWNWWLRLVQKHQCCWLRKASFFFCQCQWPLSPEQRTPNMLGAEGQKCSQKKHKLISQCAWAHGCAYNHCEVTD